MPTSYCPGSVINGAIRRGRFFAIAGVGMLGVTIIGGGIATGQLPMNLALSGQTFTGTVSAVGAQGIAVYPRAVSTVAGDQPSIAIKIDQAQLTDVCLSTVARGLPLIGDVTLFARVPGNSATAESLVIDAASVGGSLNVADVQLGLDASALGEVTGLQTSAVTVGQSWAAETTIDIISLTATGASLQGLAVTVEGRESSC